ncbi:DNA polymerase III subunit delta [Mechercharimyces sp. CAU 1602]|uniref:DNA polymerase III subunit delta n=1 Tax=Mechercharimyces sp. CAU 1602 TaxID=2973933 RepID=UPI0021632EB8|nr:DNA polymerase III subunit delta [Mechercharimyces sp. CAU 1602]MCS1350433.1 DNA polymerase III subunit delta [Mechercharimyces sp. CAU 1602]
MSQRLKQSIQRGKIAPVYLFYGSEPFLIEEACRVLKEGALPEEEPAFHLVERDLEEESIQVLIQEAQTPSFFGGRRVIIGRNARFLTTSNKKAKVEHDIEILHEYIQHPFIDNVVVLTVPVDKLDQRKKVVKSLLKEADVHPFPPLEGRELLQWVEQRLQLRGKRATMDTLKRLVTWAGKDLLLLDNECEKLSTYAGVEEEITAGMVQELVPRTLEEDIFKLVNSVGNRRGKEALSILDDLLLNREEPLRILVLLTKQIRLIMQVKVLAVHGLTDKEIATQLSAHPYPVKLARKQGESFTVEALQVLLQQAIETDVAIKSGRLEKSFALQRLILCDMYPAR